MSTDRELLELAAKAAGIVVRRSRLEDPGCIDMLVEDSARNPHEFLGPWNPLTDDGDALRLAVRLGLKVWCAKTLDLCQASTPGGEVWAGGEKCPDPYAATRRAIVRAAAEIGRAKP